MARNPFYPGYYPEKQNQTPSNPLYPGYYPGKKFPRKPRPRGPEPSHFTGFGAGDTAAKFLDDFADEIKDNATGPIGWVQKRFADDFAQSLKINALPPQGVPQEALDDYETGAVPGGGFISLNIDPREWIGIGKPGKKWMNEDGTINRDKEAPKKMLKKTLASWAKSALEFADLETVARTKFWEDIAKSTYYKDDHTFLENAAYKMATGVEPKETPFLEDAFGNRVKDRDGKYIPQKVRNPMSLDDKGIYERVEKETVYAKDVNGNYLWDKGKRIKEGTIERQTIFTDSSDQVLVKEKFYGGVSRPPVERIEIVDQATRSQWKFLSRDVFGDTLASVTDFRRNERYPLGRDRTFAKFNTDAIHAASVEMDYKMATLEGLKNADVVSFIERSKLSPTMGDLGRAMFEANRDIRQSLVGGIKLSDEQFKGIQRDLRKVKTAYEGLEKACSSVGRDALIKKHGIGFISDLDTNMGNLKKVFSSADFKTISEATLPEGLTSKIQGVLKDINLSPGLIGVAKGGGITGGSTLTPSLQQKMLTDMGGEMCLDKLSSCIDTNNLEGSKSLLLHIPSATVGRDFEAVIEVQDALFSGRAPEAYLWKGLGRFTDPTVSPLSPKYLVERAKSAVYNFGLVLNDEELRRKGWRWDNYDEPGRLFGNRFTVKFEANVNGKATMVKMKTWGGDQYKFVTKLEELMNDADKQGAFLTHQHLEQLLCKDKNIFSEEFLGFWSLHGISSDRLVMTGEGWKLLAPDGRLWDVLSDEFKDLNLLLSTCKTKEAAFETLTTIEDLQKGILGIREYLNVQFKNAGLDPKDYVTVRNYIDKLSSMSGINAINQRYIGLMQRLGRNIKKFKQVLYKVPGVAYAAKTVSALRTMAKEAQKKIQKAIQKTIEKAIKQLVQKVGAEAAEMAAKLGLNAAINAITQAVAFLGDVVAPFIAHVIAWIITQLIILLTKLVFGTIKGIFRLLKRLGKGELAEYLEEAEKKLDKTAKRLMYILIILVLINALFSPLIGFLIPDGMIPGGILTTDPFSDGIPFTLSTFSPTDPTRKWSSVQQYFDWNITLDVNAPIYGGDDGDDGDDGDGTPIGSSCGSLPAAVHYSDSYIENITNHAYEIAGDLVAGFWGSCNHSPSLYPELWNQALYDTDPNPPISVPDYDDLFWCTWMVVKSEKQSIPNFQELTGTMTMIASIKNSFSDRFDVVNRPEATLNRITPGSIVFYGCSESDNQDGCIAHVGIIYAVTSTGVITLESNSFPVSFYLPAECSDCPISGYLPIAAVAILK
jgi:hypothetical protein